jgi:hypothetical protein
LPNPPPEALFSLCAIPLLHADKQLSDLTIKELQKFEADEKYSHHVIFLVAQFYMKNVSPFNLLFILYEQFSVQNINIPY